MVRLTRIPIVAVVALGAAAAATGANALDRSGSATCKPGTTAARVAGERVCLKPGARCNRRFDRTYHRYRFHCHTGRLVAMPAPLPSVYELELRLAGPEQIVFDWTTERCDVEDVPDVPARAFRAADGTVNLLATHYVWRRELGPSLDVLRHECPIVHRFHGNADPAAFDDREWLGATFTEDGSTVHALVHNEYHGHVHPGRCAGTYDACLSNAITAAVSRDGGTSWTHSPAPAHLVAAHHRPYAPLAGPVGLFRPSNMFRNPKDGHVYAFLHQIAESGSHLTRGVCLVRTRTPDDPGSWRAWDGDSFDHQFVNPYVAPGRPCAFVGWDALHEMGESVVWNEELKVFVMVGTATLQDQSEGGFWFSFSRNLIHWTQRRRFMPAEFPWTYQCGDPDVLAYPSLLDPDSTSRNFDTSDRRAYVYFTRIHYPACHMTLDRDLVRVPVEIVAP